MRMRRHFQPVVDGLSYRIAPSGLIASPALTLLLSRESFATHAVASSHSAISSKPLSVSHSAASTASGLSMSAQDTDMPEDGTSGPILAGPPPTSGGGTGVC